MALVNSIFDSNVSLYLHLLQYFHVYFLLVNMQRCDLMLVGVTAIVLEAQPLMTK